MILHLTAPLLPVPRLSNNPESNEVEMVDGCVVTLNQITNYNSVCYSSDNFHNVTVIATILS